MKASADNVFVGATVTKEDKTYLVVKVNAKSMYVAEGWTLEQYNKALALKDKKTTFKEFCEKSKIEMSKYDGFTIADDEAAKKAVVEDSKKAANLTSALGKAEKLVLTDLLKYKKLHRLMNISVGDKIMRVLENQDDERFLININDEYVLYNRALDVVCGLGTVYDYNYEKVPWEKITPAAAAAPAAPAK